MKFSKALLTIWLLLFHAAANAQTIGLPATDIPLADLSSFQKINGTGWHIAGNLIARRNEAGNLKSQPGQGILIYQPENKLPSELLSNVIHGDIDLEMDFLLSKGAAFEIVFQNKYPVKIQDSWLKKEGPAHKAPGLWQHIAIHFRAAKFDASGKKISDARFERILLNGQPVQLPKLSSTQSVDAAFAIKGSDKAFAIKKLQYKTYANNRISVSGMTFKVYPGLHKNPDTLASLKPRRTGSTDTISHRVGDRKSQLVIDGTIDIPAEGTYLFKLTAGGGAWLFIDGKLVISNRGSRDFEKAFYNEAALKKGKFPFRIVYSNSDECLVLHYEGPQIPWQSLTTPASVRLSERFDPLEYQVSSKPAMQRGFMMHQNKVNPYVAAIALPARIAEKPVPGNNYAFDLRKYNLLAAWHGKFIDVSNMWTERGEKQLEIPLGAKMEFSGKPLVAILANANDTWPDSVATTDGVYADRGYRLDKAGIPAYFYTLKGNKVQDVLTNLPGNDGLARKLTISNSSSKLYVLLAEGTKIEQLESGSYAIDDKNYYLEKLSCGDIKPLVRKDKNVEQLILELPKTDQSVQISYQIVW
ncbi:PA14 domain-containing protein [Dyadobacter aurulentus]|uniref:PA14 domain-containing protein n=1 Tax=Dyadobacter sp. UC 10 TaxID=2605428 RepID=UPI001788E024|nr:PA14 domain-containing protein [Dyadobacter sp. UC 10]